MQTLSDEIRELLSQRDVDPLLDLLKLYDDEKDLAKCYSSFAYLSCEAAGGTRELASRMGELIEAFYLATSVHDDVLDIHDDHLQTHGDISPNTYIVLGDCFFVRMGIALARATPMIADDQRDAVIERYEQYLLDVAESQVVDEHSQGKPTSRKAAIRQMELRGGTWGRLCVEIPSLAGGLSIEEARMLGQAGENLFLALTVRDDLMDLRDDLSNGILTLAPAVFLESVGADQSWQGQSCYQPTQVDAFVDLLHSDGAIQSALDCGREYSSNALRIVNEVLRDRNDMSWYLLLMLFRIMAKRFEEFTPQDVRDRQLGSGLSGLKSIDDADIQA